MNLNNISDGTIEFRGHGGNNFLVSVVDLRNKISLGGSTIVCDNEAVEMNATLLNNSDLNLFVNDPLKGYAPCLDTSTSGTIEAEIKLKNGHQTVSLGSYQAWFNLLIPEDAVNLPSGDNCSGSFKWFQKDAYLESAGRSYPFLPPHTTTTFEVTCQNQVVSRTFVNNHGTLPAEKNDFDELFLVPVASIDVTGTRAELESLQNSYKNCDCGTTFVSLDEAKDFGGAHLEKFVDYLFENLNCSSDITVHELETLLLERNFNEFASQIHHCEWQEGHNWETSFHTSLERSVAEIDRDFNELHVCNNDAQLQAELIRNFSNNGVVGSCDAESTLCKGPKLYYSPK